MASIQERDAQVLIVGAGPTGLVLALWLTRLGVGVRLLDKTSQPGTTSRALAVQARTLEFYNQLGIGRHVASQSRAASGVHLWVEGKPVAQFALTDLGTDLSPFPSVMIFPQDEHERLLVEILAEEGVEVERLTELVDFEDMGAHVVARIRHPDGTVELMRAGFIAGCDGAHSTVRHVLGFDFPGGTYEHLFYVADIEGSGPPMNGALHVGLDRTDFLAVFPLRRAGHARLVGTIEGVSDDRQTSITWDDVGRRVIEWMKLDVERVNWFSTYRVHHRVAAHFARGRAFLAGDAAHIHSPVGGQGMNTGIGDAVNLAWKLAAVLYGRAPASLLESYQPERIAFARHLVETTDRAFTAVTSKRPLARFVRLDVVPRVMPIIFGARLARRFVFRTVSQIAVNYRGSPLSSGHAGRVHGGDRLPWIPFETQRGGADNFAPLASLDWQVHVYGTPAPAVRRLCEARQLRLHTFPWRRHWAQHGLRRDALYLVRPDGYLALVDDAGDATVLARYLDERSLTPTLRVARPAYSP